VHYAKRGFRSALAQEWRFSAFLHPAVPSGFALWAWKAMIHDLSLAFCSTFARFHFIGKMGMEFNRDNPTEVCGSLHILEW